MSVIALITDDPLGVTVSHKWLVRGNSISTFAPECRHLSTCVAVVRTAPATRYGTAPLLSCCRSQGSIALLYVACRSRSLRRPWMAVTATAVEGARTQALRPSFRYTST